MEKSPSLSEAAMPTKSTLDSTANPGRMVSTMSYYAAFIALGLIAASLGPTLPGLAENTRTQLREISFLFTARSLGYLLGSWLGGRGYDRVPGHPVMALMLIVVAITLVLVPLAPLLWLLTLLILVLGAAEGAVDVGGNTLLVWIHRNKVGPYMNALHFFFGLGAFLSPIIIAQAVLRSGGITWAYWILALLILPAAFWLLRLPSPAAQTVTKDGPAGQVNTRLVILIAIFFFLYVGVEVSFAGWIFTYAVKLNLADETMAAYLTSAFWGTYTVGRLAAIPIAFRFRPRFILLSDLLGGLLSLALLWFWSSSTLMVWVGTLGLGLSLASIFPTTISLAERRMTVTGQVTGWFFVGASAGGMCLPWLIGQFFDSSGPYVVPLFLFVTLSLATIIFFVLIAEPARPKVKVEGEM